MASAYPEPLIDIYIPTYEPDPAHLRAAIESAMAQTEPRWEMLIHDDASSVDVQNMVALFLKDSRIRFERSNTRLGIGGNWNASWKKGNAPYVQFLFQDDMWKPHFLGKALTAMESNPAIGIVSLEHRYTCDPDAQSAHLYNELEAFRREHLKPGRHDGMEILRFWLERELHPNILGEPDFIMLRRSVMEQAGKYLEDMPQNLDMEYSLRCLQHCDWYYIKEHCGEFRVHGKAASATNQREGKGIFDRFRCFEEVIKRLPKGPDRTLAINARNKALTHMAKKFLQRINSGKQIKAKGGGAFKTFAIRHPLLIARALWNAWNMQK
jgi:glycosyltransferase involved in cell wall biosynthesis